MIGSSSIEPNFEIFAACVKGELVMSRLSVKPFALRGNAMREREVDHRSLIMTPDRGKSCDRLRDSMGERYQRHPLADSLTHFPKVCSQLNPNLLPDEGRPG